MVRDPRGERTLRGLVDPPARLPIGPKVVRKRDARDLQIPYFRADLVTNSTVYRDHRRWPGRDPDDPASFPSAAEIYLMAVDPPWHRHGIGRALVQAAERDLVLDWCNLMQVKTLGAAHPSPEYAATRLFYLGVGFEPLEETDELWDENPCPILVTTLSH
ncbi:MAG: GNAT family N-acetyltransferase [Nocardioidaceae bacterium]